LLDRQLSNVFDRWEPLKNKKFKPFWIKG